jgi:enoyl-CoA hydratase/carnithine racemase
MFYQANDIQRFEEFKLTYLQCKLESHRLTITLNRPEKRNAMTPRFMDEIAFALEFASFNDEVRLVVIDANGPIFCAGADLKAFAGDVEEVGIEIPTPLEPVKLGKAFNRLYKPIIAAVHAPVFAGGFLLLGGCTHILAADTARFGLPEVNRGIWPFQVMASLSKRLSQQILLDWCMRGYEMDANQALKIGLIDFVYPSKDLNEQVNNLAQELSEKAPLAIRKGLEAYQQMLNLSPDDRHHYLKDMLEKLLASEDAAEGIQAFMEKRKPSWKNK